MSAVSIRGLTHEYGRGGAFTLGPLDLDLRAGSRTVLVGPSGCGKTTLVRVLAGLERPTGGSVSFDGRVVNDPRIVVAPERRGVGLVFQSLALWPHMTAEQNVRFATRDRERAMQLLDQVGLAGKERRRPGELSGGEAQRLAIARALASQPRLLLLDEPLRSVDPPLREEMLGLLQRLTAERSVTVLFVTHDRAEALAFGDWLLFMADGRLVEQGPPADLLRGGAQLPLAARFLGVPRLAGGAA